MPVSDPDVSRPRLIRDATFLEVDRQEIALRRGPPTIGWASRTRSPSCVCSADFPNRRPWRSTARSCGSPPCNWGADAETIYAYAGRQQTVSEHQRIGEYLRLSAFDTAAGERLARFPRRRSATARAHRLEPHQGQLVEPVGRGHEAAAGEAGTDRGDRRAGHRRELGQRQLQRILFHSVRTASADRVRRMAAPRRHLALVCASCTRRGATHA